MEERTERCPYERWKTRIRYSPSLSRYDHVIVEKFLIEQSKIEITTLMMEKTSASYPNNCVSVSVHCQFQALFQNDLKFYF